MGEVNSPFFMLGFKGFDGNLACRGYQFELGRVYKKEPLDTIPALCTDQGFHLCSTLQGVLAFYNYNTARYCIVDTVGATNSDGSKIITRGIRIIEEITHLVRTRNWDQIDTRIQYHKTNYESLLKEFEEKVKYEELKDEWRKQYLEEQIAKKEKLKQEEKARIDSHVTPILRLAKDLQLVHPELIIGGSLGLFLQGVVLQRVKDGNISDIDFISPHYVCFENTDDLRVADTEEDDKGYDNDFEIKTTINGYVVEVAIDPKSPYTFAEYEGVKYKVNTLENIWAAKIKYKNKKHRADLRDALGLNK